MVKNIIVLIDEEELEKIGQKQKKDEKVPQKLYPQPADPAAT